VGRPGPKSAGYYQNVLDAFFVVGLIDRTFYRRQQQKPLKSTLPKLNGVNELRHYCIQSSKSRLHFADLILSAAPKIQPFSRNELQAVLGLNLDNAARHIRLFVNLDVLTKGKGGYELTHLGMQYLPAETTVYSSKGTETIALREPEESGYCGYDDGLSALGFLDGGIDAR
jgi:hypothetical protein